MAIAFKINKAAFDALSDDQKSNYIAGDKDGEYVLDVTGLPTPEDVGPVKRALESERAKNKTLKGEKDALQAQIDAAPDVEALKKTHETEIGKYKSFTEKTLIDGTAMTIANAVSNSPKLLASQIKDRLVVDLSGDEPKVQIKGKDGNVDAAMTIEKLQSEVVANPDFKAIIVASKATGGGAPKPGIKPLGGGAPKAGEQSEGDKPFNFATASGPELAAHMKVKKAAQAEANGEAQQ
jgi:hypothetical protein